MMDNQDVKMRLSNLVTQDVEKCPSENSDASNSKNRSCLHIMSMKVINKVEKACGCWGYLVAMHPLPAIAITLSVVGALGCGLVYLNLLFKPYELWVPKNSEFYKVTQWKNIHFPSKHRIHIAIWEAENVLTASFVKELWKCHVEAKNMRVKVSNNRTVTWTDVCAKLPESETKVNCFEQSLLSLWNYDEREILNLTDSKVLADVNFAHPQEQFGSSTNSSHPLGEIKRDHLGLIIGASITVHNWATRLDTKAIEKGDYEVDVGSGMRVDTAGMAWERSLAQLAKQWNKNGISVNMNADHTIGDVMYYSLAKDTLWIAVGWVVLLGYVIVTLGKPFHRDQRIIPALMGLFGIGLSVLGSYGACSLMGVPYGTLTNVLPVLLVAIGVDDIYVIATAWDAIDSRKVGSIEKKAQLSMQRAGMAITVTSITDILAFAVGTTTALPGLRYFCIYSFTGIFMVYFIQATLFVAVLVLNQRWIDSKKASDSFPEDFKSDKRMFFSSGFLMRLYSKFLMFPVVKWVVLVVTAVMFFFSFYNVTQISREFDTRWLIPESSDLQKFFNTLEKSFPQKFEQGEIYFKGVEFPGDSDALNELSRKLAKMPNVIKVTAWFEEINLSQLVKDYPMLLDLSEVEQCMYLLSNIDPILLSHFNIDYDDLENSNYDNSTHPCATFKIEYQYVPPKTHEEKQDAMTSVRLLVDSANVTGFKAAWAHKFSEWETDRIILSDLFQSLSIVLVAVGLITIVLLASFRTAMFVLMCVLGTLVNVASFVHLWGLSVNTVTGIAFVLAIGICVDYAAHIAHDFLVTPGTREERVMSALNHMGLAVIHGGCSTFITFLLLSPSDSYIYVSYFKILSSVSVFGLYHALVFLPVVLSFVGADSYEPKVTSIIEDEEYPSIRPTSQSVYNLSLPPYILPKLDSQGMTDPKSWRPTHRKSKSLPSYSFFMSTVPQQQHQTKALMLQPPSAAESNKSLRHSSFFKL